MVDPNELISRAEHEEFRRRMESEDKRQNERITAVETVVKKLESLYTIIEKLAINMENMAREQERQGARLATLESRDGEMWRKTIGYFLSAIAGCIVGFIF